MATVSKAYLILHEFQCSWEAFNPPIYPHQKRSTVKWSPPPPNLYKMNVDAACSELGKWGIGAVIRDEEGRVMAAATWSILSLDDSRVAEALWVRLGMNFARDLLFLDLIVESDALLVTSALQEKKSLNSYLGSVISDCLSLEAHFHTIRYAHVGRLGNQAAHSLAKFALNNPDTVWIEEVPQVISNCVVFDILPD